MRTRIQTDSIDSATLNTQIVNHDDDKERLNSRPMIKPEAVRPGKGGGGFGTNVH